MELSWGHLLLAFLPHEDSRKLFSMEEQEETKSPLKTCNASRLKKWNSNKSTRQIPGYQEPQKEKKLKKKGNTSNNNKSTRRMSLRPVVSLQLKNAHFLQEALEDMKANKPCWLPFWITGTEKLPPTQSFFLSQRAKGQKLMMICGTHLKNVRTIFCRKNEFFGGEGFLWDCETLLYLSTSRVTSKRIVFIKKRLSSCRGQPLRAEDGVEKGQRLFKLFSV